MLRGDASVGDVRACAARGRATAADLGETPLTASGWSFRARPPPWSAHVGSKRAGPIDAIVGRTIRALRLSKGMSQGTLGRRLGVSFQQIQKYENGTNRVGAGRLAQIAMALDVPMEALLQGVQAIKRRSRPGDDPLALLSSGQAMRLARAFSKIGDGRIRIALVSLAEGIASEER
jgi:transcriptional regulator with XRE-family HTH domain